MAVSHEYMGDVRLVMRDGLWLFRIIIRVEKELDQLRIKVQCNPLEKGGSQQSAVRDQLTRLAPELLYSI